VSENTVFTKVLHRNRQRQWKSGARYVTKKYLVFVGKYCYDNEINDVNMVWILNND